MSRAFYLNDKTMIGYNPGKVYNCDCKPVANWHRKVCISRRNVCWYYKLNWFERIKARFVPAHKIFNFYQEANNNE